MAAITSAALGVAASGYSIYQGERQKKQAKQELNDYERQDLSNAFEDIEISTMGTDLAREESQLATATIVDALRGGGSRGLGMLPAIQSGINTANRQIQIDLDNQVKKREYAIAGENSRIQGIQENRDTQNLNAISSGYNAGSQMTQDGIYGGIAALGSIGRSLGSASTNNPTTNNRTTQTSLSTTANPQGYNPFGSIPQFTIPTVNGLFTEDNMYS